MSRRRGKSMALREQNTSTVLMKETSSETQALTLDYSSRIFLRLVFAECIWLLGSWYYSFVLFLLKFLHPKTISVLKVSQNATLL
jgi:hypothetical protein